MNFAQFLIIPPAHPPFWTAYFEFDNHFIEGMKVIDFGRQVIITDAGEFEFTGIEMDHL